MEQNTKKGIAFAVLAAALYAINAPFSKLLLEFVPPTLMAGFLYIGAGVGMMVIAFIKKVRKSEAKEQPLTKSELPYTIAMILLDITAPIFLLLGLNATTAANVSLLNNFEIVATAINCFDGIQRTHQRKTVARNIICHVILWDIIL